MSNPCLLKTEFASGKILVEVKEGVGVVTFNQPEKRNAVSIEMWDGIADVLQRWAERDDVRVVILTGAGDKAFVSGADITEFENRRNNADAQIQYDRVTAAGRASLATFPKPVIARIQGFCLGGGLGIAIQADLRIASEDSTFGIPAAKLGISYGLESVRRLNSLVGHANAGMLLFSGDRIDAAEARRIGLVNRVVPSDTLTEEVTKLAHAIAGNAPLSVRGMKLIIDNAGRDPAERNLSAVQAAVTACFDSADYTEGRTAFIEKRHPNFRGR